MTSSVGITIDEIQDALQRAKQIAYSNSQKRPGADVTACAFPAKRVNSADGSSASATESFNYAVPINDDNNEELAIANEGTAEVIEVPNNCVGLGFNYFGFTVIGNKGRQITYIQTETKCRVQMSAASGGNMRHCTLQGTRAAIDSAKSMIESIINRAEKQPVSNASSFGSGTNSSNSAGCTFEILIPATKCGLVIGKNGETIKSLQQKLGVKLLLVQENNKVGNEPKPLRITGEPNKVEYAYQFIDSMLESRGDFPTANQLSNTNMVLGRLGVDEQLSVGEVGFQLVIVPRSSVGIIIGKGGETIKRLAAESGAKIQFKPDEDENSSDRSAMIQGTTTQISKATMLIRDLVNKSSVGAGTEMFHMHVPSNKTGLIIGKGGETIKKICSESGAHVELSRDPPPNTIEKVFVITGTPYQIRHAQYLIRIKTGQLSQDTPLHQFCCQFDSDYFGNPYNFSLDGLSLGPQNYALESNLFEDPKLSNQLTNQWNNNISRSQVDSSQSTWQQYYTQQYNYPQETYDSYFQSAGLQTHVQTVPPSLNLQTGQPDYTAQWIEYYKSIGMHDEASIIENHMKQNPVVPASVTTVSQPVTDNFVSDFSKTLDEFSSFSAVTLC
uniref:KH domain-containing protein n=1 Tax=Syphacia muris TaxID=451379 RepID=A0A0N5AUC1_9BILA